MIPPKKFISSIPNKHFWNYPDIYERARTNSNTDVELNSNQIAEIDFFLLQITHDFCKKYLWLPRNKKEKKKIWSADGIKLQYYRSIWEQRIEQCVDPIIKSKKPYFDIIVAEMQDADYNSVKHLNERKKYVS